MSMLQTLIETKHTSKNMPGPGDPETWSNLPSASKRKRANQLTNRSNMVPAEYDTLERKRAKQQIAKRNSKFKEHAINEEGQTAEGKKYNFIWVIDAINDDVAVARLQVFKDLHWSAKNIVKVEKLYKDDKSLWKVYYIDNHKYGLWKPFKKDNRSKK